MFMYGVKLEGMLSCMGCVIGSFSKYYKNDVSFGERERKIHRDCIGHVRILYSRRGWDHAVVPEPNLHNSIAHSAHYGYHKYHSRLLKAVNK